MYTRAVTGQSEPPNTVREQWQLDYGRHRCGRSFGIRPSWDRECRSSLGALDRRFSASFVEDCFSAFLPKDSQGSLTFWTRFAGVGTTIVLRFAPVTMRSASK